MYRTTKSLTQLQNILPLIGNSLSLSLSLSVDLRACQSLEETKKSQVYPLIDRLIRLVLTLPVSTTTGEQAFLAMKIVKTRLHNKMEDEFFSDNLAVYIEKEIAENFTTDSILDEFRSLKERKLQF